MRKKKEYNIYEDTEMMSMINEYYDLKLWWDAEKEKIKKNKKIKKENTK